MNYNKEYSSWHAAILNAVVYRKNITDSEAKVVFAKVLTRAYWATQSEEQTQVESLQRNEYKITDFNSKKIALTFQLINSELGNFGFKIGGRVDQVSGEQCWSLVNLESD